MFQMLRWMWSWYWRMQSPDRMWVCDLKAEGRNRGKEEERERQRMCTYMRVYIGGLNKKALNHERASKSSSVQLLRTLPPVQDRRARSLEEVRSQL